MFKAVILLSAIVVNHAFAGRAYHAPIASVVDSSCKQEANDPYDLGWRITKASIKYPGECLDSRGRRPVQILSDDGTTMRFANVLDGKDFYVATWNKNDIPTVKFVVFYFSVGIPDVSPAHTELRFQFPHGLDLVSQTDGHHEVLSDVAISWEATFPTNKTFDIIYSSLDASPFVGRILSLKTAADENVNEKGEMRRSLEYDLKLSSAEIRRLFELEIQTSDHQKMYEFYRTFSNNCTTKPIVLIDQVMSEMRNIRRSHLYHWQARPSTDPVARPAHDGLVSMGLVDAAETPDRIATDLNLPEER